MASSECAVVDDWLGGCDSIPAESSGAKSRLTHVVNPLVQRILKAHVRDWVDAGVPIKH